MRNFYPFGRLSIVFLSLALSAPARGSVNMWSGGLTQSWTDLSSSHSSLQLRRTYHSRSMHTGVFGFGWCTEFEVKLQSQPDGSLKIRDCESGEEFRFITAPTDFKLKDKSSLRFREDGKLSQIIRSSGEILAITYSTHGRLAQVSSSKGETLKFTFDFRNERVVRVDSNQNSRVLYQYKFNELVNVESPQQEKLRYEYDQLQNLTLVEYAGKNRETATYESIEYDSIHDRVNHRQTRDGCTETYSYSTSTQGQTNRLISEARKSCRSVTVAISRHEYTHIKDEDGRIYLTEARVIPLMRGPSSMQPKPAMQEMRYVPSRRPNAQALTKNLAKGLAKKLARSPVGGESRQR